MSRAASGERLRSNTQTADVLSRLNCAILALYASKLLACSGTVGRANETNVTSDEGRAEATKTNAFSDPTAGRAEIEYKRRGQVHTHDLDRIRINALQASEHGAIVGVHDSRAGGTAGSRMSLSGFCGRQIMSARHPGYASGQESRRRPTMYILAKGSASYSTHVTDLCKDAPNPNDMANIQAPKRLHVRVLDLRLGVA